MKRNFVGCGKFGFLFVCLFVCLFYLFIFYTTDFADGHEVNITPAKGMAFFKRRFYVGECCLGRVREKKKRMKANEKKCKSKACVWLMIIIHLWIIIHNSCSFV